MDPEPSFEEWYTRAKVEYLKAGLTLPEDTELMELAYMECRADGKSIETFIEEMKREQVRE